MLKYNIIKKDELEGRQAMMVRAAAIILSFVFTGIFMVIIGYNPIQVFTKMISGALGTEMRIQETITKSIPLVITSLGILVAFKMKFWNIGGEGQIIIGAVCATYFALFHSYLPKPILLTIMFVVGALGGGIWALIPALFKVRFNTNETLFTLMLNYIGLYIIKYLENGPWRATPGFANIAKIDESARLPQISGIHIGWIFAVFLIGFIYFYLYHTKHGYEISVVGESQPTAHYAGMNVKTIILRTIFLSGAICGIAGMIQVAGIDYTLSTGVSGGVGFEGITVAWLAQLNPFVIAVVSFVFSVLEKGSRVMQTELGLSAASTGVLQGIILFFFLGCEFFVRYTFVFGKRRASK